MKESGKGHFLINCRPSASSQVQVCPKSLSDKVCAIKGLVVIELSLSYSILTLDL